MKRSAGAPASICLANAELAAKDAVTLLPNFDADSVLGLLERHLRLPVFQLAANLNRLGGAVSQRDVQLQANSNFYFNNINNQPRDHIIFNQFGGMRSGGLS